MELRYIDIHSHLNLSPLKEKKEEIISKMKEDGIGTITVGTSLETSKNAVELSKEHDMLFATIGVHPTDHEEIFDEDAFFELGKHDKVVAIGETGLDYFRLGHNGESDESVEHIKSVQKELFNKHIELSRRLGKPLMIHARPSKGSMDAYHDVLDILEGKNVRANFHFFVGDLDVLSRIKIQGHMISFDGPITFTDEYNEVIAHAPLEMIMAETDAPFAAPVPHRGKVCEPWMVVHVVSALSKVKNIHVEIVRKQLLENAKNFFKISA